MQAEQLLATAEEAGFVPDQYTTSMLVQAALAQRNIRGALRAIQKARDAGVVPSMVSRGPPAVKLAPGVHALMLCMRSNFSARHGAVHKHVVLA